MTDDEECEIEEHDSKLPRAPAMRIPHPTAGSFAICEVCAREMFENVMKKRRH